MTMSYGKKKIEISIRFIYLRKELDGDFAYLVSLWAMVRLKAHAPCAPLCPPLGDLRFSARDPAALISPPMDMVC